MSIIGYNEISYVIRTDKKNTSSMYYEGAMTPDYDPLGMVFPVANMHADTVCWATNQDLYRAVKCGVQ